MKYARIPVAAACLTIFLLWLAADPPSQPAADPPGGTPSAAATLTVDADPPAASLTSTPLSATAAATAAALPKPAASPYGHERESLWQAVAEARHAITPLLPAHAAMAHNAGVAYFASQPKNRFTMRFLHDGGLRLESASASAWTATLRLAGASATPPRKTANGRIELQHSPDLSEWYENHPDALEHGFVVQARPAGTPPQDGLQLRMHIEGLRVETDPASPGNLRLVNEAGAPRLAYRDLKVWDAAGRTLDAQMQPTADGLLLAVNDRDATYPITIDPSIVALEEEQQLIPTQDAIGGNGDYFGACVALDGDRAVVGAPSDDGPAGVDSGAALVFIRVGTSWWLEQRLSPSDSAAFDFFGTSVAIEGDTVVVGAPRGAGAAYVFTRSASAWPEQQKLSAADAYPNTYFGRSVAISADTLVVGAPGHVNNPSGHREGALYVFARAAAGSAWSQQQKIQHSNPYGGDSLGWSIAISGQSIAAGAPNKTYLYYNSFTGQITAYPYAGLGYVFAWNGSQFIEQAAFTGSGVFSSYAYFGHAVDIEDGTVVFGQKGLSKAHVYTRNPNNSWSLQSRIDGPNGTEFGYAVAIEGDTLLAGAPKITPSGGPAEGGGVYVCGRVNSSWFIAAFFAAPGAEVSAGDRFGTSVALSGNTAVVGAPYFGDINAGRAYVLVRSAGGWSLQQRLNELRPEQEGAFGNAVAIVGDTAVVGAPGEDTAAALDAGSCYVFTRSGLAWSLQQQLLASDASAYAQFGDAVSLSGESLLVGAPYADTTAANDTGAAYVFLRSGAAWSEQQKLTAADSLGSDRVGASVALDGDTAVLGAPNGDTAAAANTGTAYVFTRSGTLWSLQQKLEVPAAAVNQRTGAEVAINGDMLVVGAPEADAEAVSKAGAAYVFKRSGVSWSLVQKLTAQAPGTYAWFGAALALGGNGLLVGAPYASYSPAGALAGLAYLFICHDAEIWSPYQTLLPEDGAADDNFGIAVAYDGLTIAVGASGDDQSAGSAYVFRDSGQAGQITQQQKLVSTTAGSHDVFGCALAVSGDTLVVGAMGEDTLAGTDSGGLHVYRLIELRLQPLEFIENLPAGSLLSTVAMSAATSGWTYSLAEGVGSDDNARFTLTEGGQLFGAEVFDYEQQASRQIRIRAVKDELSVECPFVLAVVDDRDEDADGDGLTQAQEEDLYGTSDNNPDDDGDGIPGGIEVACGLDPAFDNSPLLDAIQANPQAFGVDLHALALNQPLLTRNPTTGKFTLTLDLRKSLDLATFSDLTILPDEIRVNGQGDIEFSFTSEDAAGFYRVEAR